MRRISKGVAATIVAGALLLGHTGQAAAQTTTTTSTTTTTLLPHPFSAATAACVRQATVGLKMCRIGGINCPADFQTSYAKCFAAGAGVKCATTCLTKESTCFTAAAGARKSCGKNCVTTRDFDLRACRSFAPGDALWATGDGGCLTTALTNFDLCNFNCGQQRLFCRNAFKFCIANCANL